MWKRLDFSSSAPTGSSPAKATSTQVKDAGAASSLITSSASPSSSSIVLEKTCCCGDITVRILGDDWGDGRARGHLCFCQICRRSTGSHYVHSIEVAMGDEAAQEQQQQPKIRLAIEGTPNSRLSAHVVPGLEPGSVSRRFFCARCGMILGGTASHEPNVFQVRTGGFEPVPKPLCAYLATQMPAFLAHKITDVPDGDLMRTWRVVPDSAQR